MADLLSIGEFSKATHLTVKALRHYDDVGLLVPADVDPTTGYRYYAAAQVPAGHLIRRFRELEMPLEEIKVVLAAPDRTVRDAAIAAHLKRLERTLAQTQESVAALRSLLDGNPRPAAAAVEMRDEPSVDAVAVTSTVEWDDVERWLADAFVELHRRVDDGGLEATGPDGALYEPAFFEHHVGAVTAFVPVATGGSDRIRGGRLAVAVHRGSFATLDQSYGALGAFVAAHRLGADGPVRERYIDDATTEVAWPVKREPERP